MPVITPLPGLLPPIQRRCFADVNLGSGQLFTVTLFVLLTWGQVTFFTIVTPFVPMGYGKW
jgi:hypothetical protein